MTGAGDLRERILFQSRELDENDDPLGEWTDEVSVAAQVIWLRGSETAVQQRLEGKQPVAIVIRDFAKTRQITTAWRAVNARKPEEKFAITAVSPSKQRGFLDVLAVKGGATG